MDVPVNGERDRGHGVVTPIIESHGNFANRDGWKYSAGNIRGSATFATLSTEISVSVEAFLFGRMCDRSRTEESASGVMAGGQW